MKKGFTLAEILITLTIVGIIAAMTIPSIIQNSQDSHLRSRWRKVYSEINSAINNMTVDGYINTSNSDSIADELKTELSIIKDGSFTEMTSYDEDFYYKCYKRESSSNKCNNWMSTENDYYKKTLVSSSGYLIFIMHLSGNCTGNNYRAMLPNAGPMPQSNLCMEIAVDVNGETGPNMIGKDYHLLLVLKQNGTYYVKPSGTNGAMACAPNNDSYNNSLGCSQKALGFGDMP